MEETISESIETIEIKKTTTTKKCYLSAGYMTCRAFPTFDTIPEIDTRFHSCHRKACAQPQFKEEGTQTGVPALV